MSFYCNNCDNSGWVYAKKKFPQSEADRNYTVVFRCVCLYGKNKKQKGIPEFCLKTQEAWEKFDEDVAW